MSLHRMISSFQFPVPGTKYPTHSWELSCRDSGLLQLPLDVGDSILGVFMVIPIFGRDRDNLVLWIWLYTQMTCCLVSALGCKEGGEGGVIDIGKSLSVGGGKSRRTSVLTEALPRQDVHRLENASDFPSCLVDGGP